MSKFTKLRNKAERVVGATTVVAPALQVGGATLGNVAKNALSGDSLAKNATGAAAADVVGLAGGLALGPTGVAQSLWGAPAVAGGEEAAVAPYYSGADAEAINSGLNPESGEAMNLGAEPLGYEGGAGVTEAVSDSAAVPLAGPGAPGSATPAGATAAGGGNAITRYGPLALGAAGLASNALAGRAAARRIAGIGGPQRDAGQALINQYNSGQLTIADQHSIDQYEASATAQAKQYFAKAGMSSSSSAQSALATIQGNVAAMKSQALQNYLKLGTGMLNITDQYQLSAIEQEIANDRAMWQQIFNFGSAYGAWNRSLQTMTT